MRKIKDVTRQIKKAVVAGNLRELQRKSMEKFGKTTLPRIHLDSDGTEIDDEDYFQTLESNTELIAVFSGEQWVDVRIYTFEKIKVYLTDLITVNAIFNNNNSQPR